MASRDPTWMTQIRRGLIDYFILSTLSQKESYGYQVLQDLNTLDAISLTESTLYPALARLKREGYLSMRKLKSEQGPMRNYYSLTRQGKAHLEDMFEFWCIVDADIRKLRSEFTKDGTL